MPLRLRTVRAKLTALVVLPIALVFLVLPVLGTILHDELVESSSARLVEAERSFQTELDDDFRLLALALRTMATDPEVHGAVASREAETVLRFARLLERVHPRVDVLFADASGRVFASLGPSPAPARLSDAPALAALPRDREVHSIAPHGCVASGTSAPPARFVASAAGPGTVVICEPLDGPYLEEIGDAIGLELGLLGPGGHLVAKSAHYVDGLERHAATASSLVDRASRTFAVVRLRPRLADGEEGRALALVVTTDVTDLRATVARHLAYALAVVVLVALLSVFTGARVATVMSHALMQVISAFRKLEQREYVRVPPVATRDELEQLATGFNAMVEGLEERDKLRTTFGKYMTESVVDHLMRGEVELGGETLLVTILFTDIRSFTSISERMDAHALVALLNEYFGEMVTILMRHGGVVDKYIGDAIMAVFGAPVGRPDDAEHALRAAVEMREALAKLNQRLVARGMQPLETGIGIHTGEVVAGNIGSEQRMEYTVIGDAVNLASRLEGVTKEVGVNVLISADTYERTKRVARTRPVREVTVKGREQPVMTYEVIGLLEG